jgi:hypothetical protein
MRPLRTEGFHALHTCIHEFAHCVPSERRGSTLRCTLRGLPVAKPEIPAGVGQVGQRETVTGGNRCSALVDHSDGLWSPSDVLGYSQILWALGDFLMRLSPEPSRAYIYKNEWLFLMRGGCDIHFALLNQVSPRRDESGHEMVDHAVGPRREYHEDVCGGGAPERDLADHHRHGPSAVCGARLGGDNRADLCRTGMAGCPPRAALGPRLSTAVGRARLMSCMLQRAASRARI